MRVLDRAGDYSTIAFIKTLLLATRWFLPHKGEWNEPVWSLSLEVLGYAMFPFVASWVGRIKRVWQALSVVLGSLLGLIIVTILLQKDSENPIGQFAVARMVCCFVAGIGLCRLWRLTPSLRRLSPAAITTFASSGIFLATVLPHCQLVVNFFFAALLYGLAFQRGSVNRLLSSPQALFLGRISFPLYLVSVVPLFWLQYRLSTSTTHLSTSSMGARGLLLAAYLVFCFALATLLHYGIERPAHAFGRRWVVPSALMRQKREKLEALEPAVQR